MPDTMKGSVGRRTDEYGSNSRRTQRVKTDARQNHR